MGFCKLRSTPSDKENLTKNKAARPSGTAYPALKNLACVKSWHAL